MNTDFQVSSRVALDPAIHAALRAALAMLFAWAAFHKLRDVSSFREVLANYELLPASLTTAAAAVAIGAEMSIALALLLSVASAPALGAAALLGIYSVAIAINVRRGRRDIDCGCTGPAQRRPLSGALIGRNLVLVAVALISSLQSSSRVLLWVDALTIIGAVAFLCVLYGAIDTITFNAPYLAVIRGAAGGHAHKPSSPQALAAMDGEAE